MEDVRKADPTFTGFVPRTAVEAVDRYVRCRKNGLKPMLVPECLIECAKGLNEEQLDLFEAWCINPNGEITGTLVPENSIREANNKIYMENLKRLDELPPLPLEPEQDEKQELLEQPGSTSSEDPSSTRST